MYIIDFERIKPETYYNKTVLYRVNFKQTRLTGVHLTDFDVPNKASNGHGTAASLLQSFG